MGLTFFIHRNCYLTVLDNLNDRIRELAETVLEGRPLFVVDVQAKGQKGSRTVWIYIDSVEGGVNLDECAKISEELSLLFDAHNVIDGSYRLNISSPGLDRPLVDRRQYLKNVGRNAAVRFSKAGDEQRIEGIIKRFEEDRLIIQKKDGSTESVDYGNILETKILAAW